MVSQGALIGRDQELEELERFLDGGPERTLVLAGPPGIGKTTVWEAGLAVAARHGHRVLVTRSSSEESGLGYAGLADLLDGVDLGQVQPLAAPQRRSLDVALLRREQAEPIDARAVGAGLLTVLRRLAVTEPLLVAVDDLPWLDPATLAALTFAARRLEHAPVRFLLASRRDRPTRPEVALERGGLRRLRLEPLSLGATRRLLSARLGLALPRRALRRLHETAAGNPLFALELGRVLAESDPLWIGEEVPLPATLEELLRERVAGLARGVRRTVLAVALEGGARLGELSPVVEPGAIAEAVDLGVLTVERDRVRLSHPLLGAVVRRSAPAGDLGELHRELAAVVEGKERRARHLALATSAPDEAVAATVSSAAARAATRGAAADAVELSGHALRLTQPDAPHRAERLVELCEHLSTVGEHGQVRELLAPEIGGLPPGPPRVRARLLLCDASPDYADVEAQLTAALTECGGDRELRATVLALRAIVLAVGRVEGIGEAEALVAEALESGDVPVPRGAPSPLFALAWLRILRGRPIDDLVSPDRLAGAGVTHIYYGLERLVGIRHSWRGELAQADATFRRLLALADERGESESYVAMRVQLCELALRTGDWAAAAGSLEEWSPADVEAADVHSAFLRCRALLAARRGFAAEAARFANEATAAATAAGVRWQELEAKRAEGIAALLAGEPDRAVESLGAVWEHTTREGIDEPGAFPVAPDLVEALVQVGSLDEAQAVTKRLGRLSREQEHPWGRASAARCRGLVRGTPEPLREAADAFERLGLRFDRARVLLALGQLERRSRHWGAAREALGHALSAFEEMDSPGWAEAVRSELGRIGGRRPSTGLSETEARLAALVAAGRTNKQIAAALHLSEKTVEANLTRIFRKQGVHSRTELAHTLDRARDKAREIPA